MGIPRIPRGAVVASRGVVAALMVSVLATVGTASAGTSSSTPMTDASAATAVAAAADPVLVGAGDIAECGSRHWADEATADLIDKIPGTVFTTGDNAYDDGTESEFSNCYGPTWGRFKDRTRPAPGNHDYETYGASGYFDYFGDKAGDSSKGYYSYDIGANWHVLVVNSNCDDVSCAKDSEQEKWVRADLAANTKSCVAAYWHHPRWTSGDGHGNATEMGPIVQALYDNNADVVLTGHNHIYERFAQQNPEGKADTARGIRQFTVGTGGADLYGFNYYPEPNSEARNSDSHGVLKMTLHADSYDWQFVPIEGDTYTGSGTTSCHAKSTTPTSAGPLVGVGSKLCLTAPDGPQPTDLARVTMQGCDQSPNPRQKWALNGTSGEIKAANDLCLDAAGGQSAERTPVLGWPCSGSANQKWALHPDGTITGIGGKCVDVVDNATTPGTKVWLYTCNTTTAQKWIQ